MTTAPTPITAIALSCTLKASPAESSTDLLCQQILDALAEHDVEGTLIRVVDHDVKPGVTSDEGDGDAWPAIRQEILDADILVLGTPIWLGQPSSVCKRVLERMDAFISETDDGGRMVSMDKVAVLATVGNEDGAHAVAADTYQALIDVGFTIPPNGQAYWVGEAMGSTDYKDLDEPPEKVVADRHRRGPQRRPPGPAPPGRSVPGRRAGLADDAVAEVGHAVGDDDPDLLEGHGAGPMWSSRRTPPPRSTGATLSWISSTAPSWRSCWATSAPQAETYPSPATSRAWARAASTPSGTKRTCGLHRPSVGGSWVTTKIGASIGWPSAQPLAMSKVRRPLIMAPAPACHSSTIGRLASGGRSRSSDPTVSGPAPIQVNRAGPRRRAGWSVRHPGRRCSRRRTR